MTTKIEREPVSALFSQDPKCASNKWALNSTIFFGLTEALYQMYESGKVSLVDYKAAEEALWTARRIARNERDGK